MSPTRRNLIRALYPSACAGEARAIEALRRLLRGIRRVQPCAICGQPAHGARCDVHNLRLRSVPKALLPE